MRSKNLLLYCVAALLLTFTGCKKCEECEKELKATQAKLKIYEDSRDTNNGDERTFSRQSIPPVSIAQVSESDLKKRGYNNNLQVIGTPLKPNETYVNCATKTITLKFPVTNKDFDYKKILNISSQNKKAILYIISDGTSNEILTQKTTNLLTHTFKFSDVELGPFNLNKNEKLHIYVYNDNFDVNNQTELDTVVQIFKKRVDNQGIECIKLNKLKDEILVPKEACGGVVVGG